MFKAIITLIALFVSCHADEAKEKLEDFTIPVPANFVAAAEGAFKARGENLYPYLKAMGIRFPEGSSIKLVAMRKVLEVKIPHQEALHLIQLINAFMGDSADEWAKELLEGGTTLEGPENRCFDPPTKQPKATQSEQGADGKPPKAAQPPHQLNPNTRLP